jgi:hypothetical protein
MPGRLCYEGASMKSFRSRNPDGSESAFSQPVGSPLRGITRYFSSVLIWMSIAVVAIVILIFEYLLGWFIFFSPGWANGWPDSLSYQLKLSVGITGYDALMLITAAYAAGAIVGFVCALFRVGETRRFAFYIRWLWFAAFVILCLSIVRFPYFYNWIGPEPPNLYGN